MSAGVQAVSGAVLRVNSFKEFFIRGPAADFDTELGTNARGDLCGHRAAKGGIESVPALQEHFNQVELLDSDMADIVGGRGSIDVRFLKRPGGFDVPFVDDDGAGHKIAEAFVLFAEKDANDGDAVKDRKLVNDPQQVARYGVVGADRAAVILDHAELRVSFARSLAVP